MRNRTDDWWRAIGVLRQVDVIKLPVSRAEEVKDLLRQYVVNRVTNEETLSHLILAGDSTSYIFTVDAIPVTNIRWIALLQEIATQSLVAVWRSCQPSDEAAHDEMAQHAHHVHAQCT